MINRAQQKIEALIDTSVEHLQPAVDYCGHAPVESARDARV